MKELIYTEKIYLAYVFFMKLFVRLINLIFSYITTNKLNG